MKPINYQIDATGDWLQAVRIIKSPNCNLRPQATDIDLLVIHSISLPPNEYGGGYIDQLFTNTLATDAHPYFKEIAALQVSAHLFIDRHGVVTQYVPFSYRAWHAGHSHFKGRDNCNDFSIGIELEGSDQDPYTEAQYLHLAAITDTLCQHFSQLKKERIVRHSDIAPGRKTDPGVNFDKQKYLALLSSE